MSRLGAKVRQTKERELDSFALTGKSNTVGMVIERMADKERRQLKEVYHSMSGKELVLDDSIKTSKMAVRTITDLTDKVINVLEEGLEDEEKKYDVALGCAKYLFETRRSVTGKVDSTVNVVFENISQAPPIKIEPADFKTLTNNNNDTSES